MNKFRIGPTLMLPYFQVNRTTTGRQHMMTQDKIRIAVRMTQFRDTTQGRSSSQDSQPSAHCRHSNIAVSLYWLSISCRQWRHQVSMFGVKCFRVKPMALSQDGVNIVTFMRQSTAFLFCDFHTNSTPDSFVFFQISLERYSKIKFSLNTDTMRTRGS